MSLAVPPIHAHNLLRSGNPCLARYGLIVELQSKQANRELNASYVVMFHLCQSSLWKFGILGSFGVLAVNAFGPVFWYNQQPIGNGVECWGS